VFGIKKNFITFLFNFITFLKKSFFDGLILLKLLLMKVRWREHEMIFVTVLVVSQMIFTIWELYNPSEYPHPNFAAGFDKAGLSFVFWRNVLLPQIGSFLLVYLTYLCINLLIIPSIKKISFKDVEKLLTLTLLKPILLIAATSYLLAIGINVITYYARPHLFDYGDYQLLASLGYNDNPLKNVFLGFEGSIAIVLVFIVLAGIRELIIWLIDRPGPSREFRALVINNITPLLFVYFLIPFLINPVHDRFMDYLAWITPVLAIYIYNTFWLFPFSEGYKWRQGPVLVRLLLSTFAGALFFTIVFRGGEKLIGFSLYWPFLLLIVTPLTRLLYQQRKDKILQLKGMETALAKSTTDLQFLRSQINPHFLFNALNTLYGTALKEKSEQTAEGIQMLGDMMRFMLHENNLDSIPMNKELEYLKNYIALQKLRTPPSPGILIADNIDEVKCNHPIAPMLLIPFVENAFKHGISLNEKSWITIKLECAESFIWFEVRNSIHNRFEGDTERDKSGIGLTNVAERLRLLYPGKHELNVRKNENEFIAKLVIK
jgi:two-component system, LytTR family, sensor kinase